MALAALIWAATAAAQPLPAVVADARARAQAGDPGAALRLLEGWIARNGGRTTPIDSAAIQLEAARTAVASSNRDQVVAHLAAAERLAGAFGGDPALKARFHRELARLWEQLGNASRTEAQLHAALAAWPANDPDGAADAGNALGTAQLELRRPADAAASFADSLDLLDRAGAIPARRVATLVNLATARLQAGSRAAAEEATARAEAVAGAAPPLRRAAALARAQMLMVQPDLRAAERILTEVADQADPADPVRGHALFLLATARFNRGLTPEAVQAGLAASAAYRSSLGEWHPALARTLHLLGTAYGELRDRKTATGFFTRADEIARRALGPAAAAVQATAIDWAWLELQDGDLGSAERRAGGVVATLGVQSRTEPRLAGLAQILVGLIAEARGQAPEAIARYRAGQQSIELAGPSAATDLGFSLVRLGRLLTRGRRLNEARAPIERAITVYQRAGGAGTARLADALMARAELQAATGDRHGALDTVRQAYAALHLRLAEEDVEHEGGLLRRGVRDVLAADARLLIQIGQAEPDRAQALEAEAFEVSQEALASRAGEALRQAIIRQSLGNGPHALLLREREEVADTLRQLATLEGAAAQRGDPDAAREAARLAADRTLGAQRLATLDRQIASAIPGVASQMRTAPVTIGAARDALAPDAAVIATVTTADGLLVWVFSREGVRTTLSALDSIGIAGLVRRVRAGVDVQAVPQGGALPAFDLDAAKQLYEPLLGSAAPLLTGKRQLVFVLDGALQSLPPALLYGEGDWLVRRFAVSVMPSLDALVSAAAARRSAAPRGFLGVGDPILPNLSADTPAQVASRGPLPDLRLALGGLQPLPETRTELGRIAGLFEAKDARLMLGAEATRSALNQAVPAGYRTIAFATHAVMAGELPGITEPAIVLTADGPNLARTLLTASDVAAMTLDADLVLLSACNTAAPDGGPFAEGLSGLARSFLHAGARSLLVSHWAVDSQATVELTTGFMARLRSDPAPRRSEALRTAMLSLLDGPDPALHHPALWAPFVLVGQD